MLKYFSLVLDLLEIEPKSEYLCVAEKIVENIDSKLFCYHRHRFLFVAFKELLEEEISLEEFIQIWDVDSSKKIYDPKIMNSVDFLDWVKNKIEILDKESLYIVDKLSWELGEVDIDGVEILYC